MAGNHAYGYIPRKRRPSLADPVPVESAPVDGEPFDMSRLSLGRRLALAERFVAAHPGRSITAMLLDLFPELRRIEG